MEQRALRAVEKVILTHLKGYPRRKQPEGHFNTVTLTFADRCPLDLSVPINTEEKIKLDLVPTTLF